MTDSTPPILQATDVRKRYGSLEVLHGVSMSIGRGPCRKRPQAPFTVQFGTSSKRAFAPACASCCAPSAPAPRSSPPRGGIDRSRCC